MKNTIVLLLLAIILVSCSQNHKTNISGLSVEYLTNPLGVDVEQPRFSWQIVSDERDVKQVAYLVFVGEFFK
jgi:alpha-L-rhamnosidase